MQPKIWFTASLLLVLCACQSEHPSAADAHSEAGLSYESDGFVVVPFDPDRAAQPGLPSGKWLIQNGIRICDGYLTRFDDEDFCAATVPEDWVSFEFNGNTYYKQPLAAP